MLLALTHEAGAVARNAHGIIHAQATHGIGRGDLTHGLPHYRGGLGTQTAQQIEPIAASDRVRGALLSALSHDLRRPLAAAAAAVGGLKAAGPDLALTDKKELLDTADESLAALAALVTRDAMIGTGLPRAPATTA